MAWGPGDFALAGTLVDGAGLAFEGAARASSNRTYRIAAGVALATALALVSLNLAVGLMGAYDDVRQPDTSPGAGRGPRRHRSRPPAAPGHGPRAAGDGPGPGGLRPRWRSPPLGAATPHGPWDFLVLDGIFTASWVHSATLFRHAARARPSRLPGGNRDFRREQALPGHRSQLGKVHVARRRSRRDRAIEPGRRSRRRPCVRGLRVTVAMIIGLLAHGAGGGRDPRRLCPLSGARGRDRQALGYAAWLAREETLQG